MRRRWVYVLCTVLLPASISRPARAVDPFEIQVYDGTAVPQDAFAVELHTNAYVRGLPANPPELALDHQVHFTFEPQYGLFPWWEIGGYFQTAIADGFDFAGAKLRSKWVTPPNWHPTLRFGLNVEVSVLPNTFDRNVWGMELRPIAAFENDHWMFAINPIVDVALAGPDFAAGPTFEPAVKGAYKWPNRVAIGLEYYGNFGPLSGFLPVSQQEHYIYEVVDVLTMKNVELNLGFGEGLTDGSSRFIVKMILGYTWEHVLRRPTAR